MNLGEIVNIANRLQREALIFFAIIGIIILVCFEIFFKSELNLLSLIVLILSYFVCFVWYNFKFTFFRKRGFGTCSQYICHNQLSSNFYLDPRIFDFYFDYK